LSLGWLFGRSDSKHLSSATKIPTSKAPNLDLGYSRASGPANGSKGTMRKTFIASWQRRCDTGRATYSQSQPRKNQRKNHNANSTPTISTCLGHFNRRLRILRCARLRQSVFRYCCFFEYFGSFAWCAAHASLHRIFYMNDFFRPLNVAKGLGGGKGNREGGENR
jgi:hypothetical protein